jgi:hypothetical protein
MEAKGLATMTASSISPLPVREDAASVPVVPFVAVVPVDHLVHVVHVTLLAGMLGLLSTLPACSSGSGVQTFSEQANPCATRNATYLETGTEQPGGTCGPFPSQVVNIGADGSLTLPSSISCASFSQDGCTARATDCTFSSQGYDFTETFETTFASDGSSAQGILTISGTGHGQTCSSTYDVTMTRQ